MFGSKLCLICCIFFVSSGSHFCDAEIASWRFDVHVHYVCVLLLLITLCLCFDETYCFVKNIKDADERKAEKQTENSANRDDEVQIGFYGSPEIALRKKKSLRGNLSGNNLNNSRVLAGQSLTQ